MEVNLSAHHCLLPTLLAFHLTLVQRMQKKQQVSHHSHWIMQHSLSCVVFALVLAQVQVFGLNCLLLLLLSASPQSLLLHHHHQCGGRSVCLSSSSVPDVKASTVAGANEAEEAVDSAAAVTANGAHCDCDHQTS